MSLYIRHFNPIPFPAFFVVITSELEVVADDHGIVDGGAGSS